jgi:hypothetical protein
MKSIKWAIAALLLAQSAHGGDITYDLLNNPQDHQGWNLSGTITTDGKLGALTSDDILSWAVTITESNKTYSFNSSEPWKTVVTSDVSATPTALNLGTGGELILGASLGGNSPTDYLIWGPSGFTQAAQPQYNFPNIWTIHDPTDNPCGPPWTIATVPNAVPEPSSFVLICGALTLLGGYSRFRNRV